VSSNVAKKKTKWSSTAGKCSSIKVYCWENHGTKSAELQVGFSKRWMIYDDIYAAHFNISNREHD